MGPMPSPGGKGRGGPSPGQFPFPDVVERYDGAPEYTTPFVENPRLYDSPDFRIIGGEYGGGGLAMGPAVMPDYSNAGYEVTQPFTQPDFGAAAAAGLRVGTPIGGGGGKMKMGGQTAYPNQNVLSSYMMG